MDDNNKLSVDLLLAEIGSTTTVMNCFTDLDGDNPVFLGQGQSHTTVLEGDVSIGLQNALDDLKDYLGVEALEYKEMLATSSAAGGLRMTVHGLVYDMTVRAAKEAALGSGAVIKMVTAGRLRRGDMKKIQEINPKMLFLAGGTDYGERDTALHNYEVLMQALPDTPLVYAGNIENHDELKLIAEEEGYRLYLCENVYPSLDQLNIEPARHLIHKVFEEHIIHSPGMEKIRDLVSGTIMPTPGAVMEAAMLAKEQLGDVLVFDVGGATTDLHSVTEGTPQIRDIQIQAEPYAKRTVEGDLGLFVNRRALVAQYEPEEARERIPNAAYYLEHMNEIPTTPEEKAFVTELTRKACRIALERHAGKFIDLYGPTGRQTLAEGKDLTAIKHVIGTGGALTRLPYGIGILQEALEGRRQRRLFPGENLEFHLDHDYIMAALGAIAQRHPRAARLLLLKSLHVPFDPAIVDMKMEAAKEKEPF